MLTESPSAALAATTTTLENPLIVRHALERVRLRYLLSVNGCYLRRVIDDDAELPYANELVTLRMQIHRRFGLLVKKNLLRSVVRSYWGMAL